MSTNQLAAFNDSVNNLIQGKLILVDKNIATLLKCVATTPILCKCLAETVQTTTYATEFSRAKVTWTTADGRVVSQLKMPVDRNRLFSFVVCLLTEVDSGRRNFLDFLKEFYHPTDSNLGYEKFANEVLRPFKTAGISLLSQIDPESLSAENVSRAEKFFSAEQIYIDTQTLQKLFQQIEIINVKAHGEGFSANATEEIAIVCEYFSNALYLKNPKILWIVWVAFQRTMQRYEVFVPIIAEMSQTISAIFR